MAHTRYIAGSQSALKSRIAELENAQTLSTTDVDRLRARIDNVEREKCDLAGVISLRLKQENESRDEEIQALCSNLKKRGKTSSLSNPNFANSALQGRQRSSNSKRSLNTCSWHRQRPSAPLLSLLPRLKSLSSTAVPRMANSPICKLRMTHLNKVTSLHKRRSKHSSLRIPLSPNI
ncbi:hypothetical protein AX14_001814 [Amanita brunnescens Koide BX004]|nr:hypothetical protein AX14_001814 [Amanita brunnescens Koide BX004]